MDAESASRKILVLCSRWTGETGVNTGTTAGPWDLLNDTLTRDAYTNIWTILLTVKAAFWRWILGNGG
jgi:hypothetical protein